MNTLKIDAPCGSYYPDLVERAKQESDGYDYAFFDFNGIEVRVSPRTDVDLLRRDRDTAYLLGWDVIGPEPFQEYPEILLEEIGRAVDSQQKEAEIKAQEYRQKMEKHCRMADHAMASEGFYVYASLRAEYAEWKAQNSDGYSLACFELAEKTAALAESLAAQRKTHIQAVLHEASDIASDACGGCSGYQWGVAKQILKRYWLYRELVEVAA